MVFLPCQTSKILYVPDFRIKQFNFKYMSQIQEYEIITKCLHFTKVVMTVMCNSARMRELYLSKE